MRLRREYGSSTRPSPPALPPIGQRTGSAYGCSRNIASAQALTLLTKARFFVLGYSDLNVAVDHKPLLKILGDRSLDVITNKRLWNLKEKPSPSLIPYREWHATISP